MEFRILGPLAVRSDTGVVPLSGNKRRALLALLLLHANEPVSAERLAIGLWGEDAPAAAVGTVRVHVSRLRSALGEPDVLVTTPAGYELRVRPGELDAERFERLFERGRRALSEDAKEEAAAALREALGLWRGPALADLRFEAFAQAEIARLEELRWEALEARNDAELALGHLDAVLADLERRAVEAPLRERLIEQRMRALYRAGRQADALAVYREARVRLDAELGLAPGPALRELERAILAHDPALAGQGGPNARPAASAAERARPAAPPTATVGRERELATVAEMLAESRLVTLTGPGGVGKTRVALEAARALADRSCVGVHLAWLARVGRAVDVPAVLARAVGVVARPGERIEDALVRRLASSDSVFVVDNVEHVLEAAPLLADLLAACPLLRILATSREPLRLRGERCLPIAPLDDSQAIRLFVDRARDRRPDFGLSDANAPAVAAVCRRLDGLPLAVELAAGRIGLLEPAELLARLTDALPLLEGGARDAPTHQRTIRGTLEWSSALLDENERRTFVALGVFVGGADLDAAEVVTQAPLAVLDALVAKSLVQRDDGRLMLLEVVRQFAATALAQTSLADAVQRRHAKHYLALAERLGPRVRVTGQGPALRRLERELGNLRAALDYWSARGDGERTLRLAAALEPYWFQSNHYLEGLQVLDAALSFERAASAHTRGRALLAKAVLQRRVDPHTSRATADAALALTRAADDFEGQCMTLDLVARHAAFEGDFPAHRAFVHEQRELAERLGDPYHIASAIVRRMMGEPGDPDLRGARVLAAQATPLLRRCGSLHRIAELLTHVVMCAFDEEDYQAAIEHAAEGLRAAREANDTFAVMVALGNAGLAALFLERMDAARRHFRDQLAICRLERLEGAWVEPALGLAAIAAHARDHRRAATLAGASMTALRRHVADADQAIFERLIARFIAPARAALGEPAWEHAIASGAALTREELYDVALQDDPRLTAAVGAAPRRD